MGKIKLSVTAFVFLLAGFFQSARAQQFDIHPVYYTIFDQDSLAGFNESEARAIAIHERYLGSEFKIKMYRMKREYINQKYNLVSGKVSYQNNYFTNPLPATTPVVPGCTNEDFEASTAGPVTTTNQIAGWTIVEGYNGFVSAGSAASLTAYYPNGLSGANSCNLTGCCPMPPAHTELIDCSAPGGYVDNTIGSQYPIFSVFGTGTVSGAASTNSQITQGMFGTKVLRLNDENTGDYSMAKLSKTFSVSSSNALFQFAFISVFAPGHGCCDAGAFQIKLYDNGTSASGTPTTISCPSFSVSAPSTACTATVPMTYYIVNSWTPNNPNNFNNIYNPWKISSLDLSSYIGKYITIEVITSDCTAGGHFGCVYFDAQCGPMTVYGNGNAYDAGSNVVVPTCGAAGATICAADGLGPYSWAGTGVTPDQGVPSMTNQCITTTISTTYTLYMQPQGACTPISRVVQSSITPAPLLLISGQQAQCGNTLAVVNVTPSGSAMNPSSLIWSPTPLSLNSATTSGQFFVPLTGGGTPTLVSVTAADPLGCKITATINVNPAPPVPTFTIQNVTNSPSLTCSTPSVDLSALTNYTYGTLSYFWASASNTFSQSSINVVNPATYTVTAFDPVTNCGVTQTISIGANLVAPSTTATPMFQNITCANAAASNVTLSAVSNGVNMTQILISPTNGTFVSQAGTVQAACSGPGLYSYCVRNDENGCMTCKTITVTSSDAFPTYQLSSPQSFTLGCSTKSVATIDIVGGQGGGGGVVNYTLLLPGSSTITPIPIPSANTHYTVNAPGTYTVVVQDNVSFCETRTPISVISNTFAPDRSISFQRQILNCFYPSVNLVGVSQNANASFEWNFPFAPGTLANDSLSVNTLTASSNNSVVGVFTLNVTDNANACKSQTIMTVFQNLYKPVAVISGLNALTCKVGTITLNNQSSTSIPAGTFPNTKPVTGIWNGPSPQEQRDSSTSYVAGVPGDYTMTAVDKNNGCSSSTVFTVADKRIYPLMSGINGRLRCGAVTATVSFNSLDGLSDNQLDIRWTRMEGTAVGNSSDSTKRQWQVTRPGNYQAFVTTLSNGCVKTVSASVLGDSLTADFDIDNVSGYAPLTVKFKNTSRSADSVNTSAGISSIWNFGNGDTAMQASKNFDIPETSVFRQPGTYTVTLYINRGVCLEQVSKIIQVEVPSSVEIPNVFTPNGDGVNDIYFIKAASLSDINAVIYDRWGHVVYELKNEKGRIEWDGKNQYGKECAEGTYFYMIKATGADGKAFDEKGTITLAR